MTKLKAIAFVGSLCTVLAILLAPDVAAQLDEGRLWKATISNSFYVEDRELPAGDYIVRWFGGRIQIQSADGKQSVSILTFPLKGKATPESGRLEFSHYGDVHYLSSIWFAGREEGRELLKSRIELSMAKRFKPKVVAVLETK